MLQPDLIYPGVVSVFLGVNGEFGQDDPHCTTYLLGEEDAAALPSAAQKSLVVQHRSRYSPGFAPDGKSVIHCTYFTDYHFWKKLRTENRAEYRAQKRKVASFVQGFLERRYPGLRAKTEIVDVTSPATTERYTGNRAGSILAWKAFTKAEDLANRLINKEGMRLPGLRGFYMAGQWIGGGGLIRAAASGRFVTQFICRDLKRPFKAWESEGSVVWRRSKLDRLPQLDEELAALDPMANE